MFSWFDQFKFNKIRDTPAACAVALPTRCLSNLESILKELAVRYIIITVVTFASALAVFWLTPAKDPGESTQVFSGLNQQALSSGLQKDLDNWCQAAQSVTASSQEDWLVTLARVTKSQLGRRMLGEIEVLESSVRNKQFWRRVEDSSENFRCYALDVLIPRI